MNSSLAHDFVASPKNFGTSENRILRLILVVAMVILALSGAQSAWAVKIAAGASHGLLIRDDGTLWIWGYNFEGQFGDGSTVGRSVPVRIMSNVSAAAAGKEHTLALKTDGTLWAWGKNEQGQLGTSNLDPYTLPKQIMSGVKAVAAGYYHSMALKTDGTLWVWGNNAYSQLGEGTTVSRNAPFQLLTGVKAIGAGQYHSMAIKNDGTLWVWGANEGGQVGNNSSTNRTTPIQVLTSVTAATGGRYHSLAIRSDNTLWVWGYNGNGQLGDGTLNQSLTPKQVNSNVKGISAGSYFSMALKTDETAWTWGFNGSGQLGDTTYTQRTSPFWVGTGMNMIAAGDAFGMISGAYTGTVWAWGYNGGGQTGDGSTVARSLPVFPLTEVQAAVAGGYHSLALRTDGSVWSWGGNTYGQLGNGNDDARFTPGQVLAGAKSVGAGLYHSAAIKTDGSLWTWGANSNGQLGNGNTEDRSTPAQVLTGVQAVALGGYHTLVLKTDGSVWATGDNYYGQLGNGSTADRTQAVQVLTSVKSVAAGGVFSLALRTDGTLWAWGHNADGQVGDGTNLQRNVPVQILTNVASMSAGWRHGLAVKTDGSLWTWGSNTQGRLGDGSTTNRLTPVQVMTGVSQAAGSTGASFALKTDGTLWAWGANSTQMIGPGAADQELRPRLNPYVRGYLTSISGGNWHALGVTSGRRVAIWGNNYAGLLGIAFNLTNATPARVQDPLIPYSNTTLVTEHFNPTIRNGAGTLGIGHYFITAGAGERAGIETGAAGAGWGQTGRTFRVWGDAASGPAGVTGVCRFYAGQPNSHFYTSVASECQNLRNMNPTNNPALGWAYEGIAFYTVLPTAAGCPSGYHPIYRSYNNRYDVPERNDVNHRLTPSYNDHYRMIKFFGFLDEGVAFCSPVNPYTGGDLQVSYAYPGATVQSGAAVAAEFVFNNNGGGKADGGIAHVNLPPEVANWTVTCSSRLGAPCPASTELTAAKLRVGTSISPWPAGAGITLTAQGTAPQIGVGSEVALNFGATVSAPTGLADGLTTNNTPSTSQTVVKAANVCSFAVNPGALALGSSAQTSNVSVTVGEGCSWNAASPAGWAGLATGNGQPAANAAGTGTNSVKVSVTANAATSERTATLTIAGKQIVVNQAGAPPPVNNCSGLRLSRTGDPVPAKGSTGSVSFEVIADANCAWQALSQAPWISIVSGGSGQGNGIVRYMVEANLNAEKRSGSITIGGQPFAVNQWGGSGGGGEGDGGGDGGGGE